MLMCAYLYFRSAFACSCQRQAYRQPDGRFRMPYGSLHQISAFHHFIVTGSLPGGWQSFHGE